MVGCVFFFKDTATTEIYTLSLHDALPICLYGCVNDAYAVKAVLERHSDGTRNFDVWQLTASTGESVDRKSTRLNSSHANISYAVFCLQKKYLCTELLAVLSFHLSPTYLHP